MTSPNPRSKPDPEALTFFGVPFADSDDYWGPAAQIAPNRCAVVSKPGDIWNVEVVEMGWCIVWIQGEQASPALLRRAETAYRNKARELAEVAGLEVEDD